MTIPNEVLSENNKGEDTLNDVLNKQKEVDKELQQLKNRYSRYSQIVSFQQEEEDYVNNENIKSNSKRISLSLKRKKDVTYGLLSHDDEEETKNEQHEIKNNPVENKNKQNMDLDLDDTEKSDTEELDVEKDGNANDSEMNRLCDIVQSLLSEAQDAIDSKPELKHLNANGKNNEDDLNDDVEDELFIPKRLDSLHTSHSRISYHLNDELPLSPPKTPTSLNYNDMSRISTNETLNKLNGFDEDGQHRYSILTEATAVAQPLTPVSTLQRPYDYGCGYGCGCNCCGCPHHHHQCGGMDRYLYDDMSYIKGDERLSSPSGYYTNDYPFELEKVEKEENFHPTLNEEHIPQNSNTNSTTPEKETANTKPENVNGQINFNQTINHKEDNDNKQIKTNTNNNNNNNTNFYKFYGPTFHVNNEALFGGNGMNPMAIPLNYTGVPYGPFPMAFPPEMFEQMEREGGINKPEKELNQEDQSLKKSSSSPTKAIRKRHSKNKHKHPRHRHGHIHPLDANGKPYESCHICDEKEKEVKESHGKELLKVNGGELKKKQSKLFKAQFGSDTQLFLSFFASFFVTSILVTISCLWSVIQVMAGNVNDKKLSRLLMNSSQNAILNNKKKIDAILDHDTLDDDEEEEGRNRIEEIQTESEYDSDQSDEEEDNEDMTNKMITSPNDESPSLSTRTSTDSFVSSSSQFYTANTIISNSNEDEKDIMDNEVVTLSRSNTTCFKSKAKNNNKITSQNPFNLVMNDTNNNNNNNFSSNLRSFKNCRRNSL